MFFHIIKIIHNLRDRDLRIHGRNDFSQTKRLAKATLTLIPLFAVTNFVYQLFDILLHKKLSQLEQQIARLFLIKQVEFKQVEFNGMCILKYLKLLHWIKYEFQLRYSRSYKP